MSATVQSNTLRRTKIPGWFELYREVCPICGHVGGCMINEEGEAIACIRQESKIAFSKNSACPSWLHFLKEKKKVEAKKHYVEGNPKKAESTLNAVYQALIDCTYLEDAHYEHLTSSKRQLTDRQIVIREYRSFPEKPWEVVREISERTGIEDFTGIPGFYKAKGRYGDFWSIAGTQGILIPFRNYKNEITGFQIRVDNPPNDVEIKRLKDGFAARVISQPNLVQILYNGEIIQEVEMELKKEIPIRYEGTLIGYVRLVKGKRYFWLSSANKPNGTSPGNPAPVHTSIPTTFLTEWKSGEVYRTKTIWLGEGPLKGDIAVDLITQLYDELELKDIGTTILSLPGAGAWRLALPILEQMGVEQINICFDMDAMTNPYVKKHLMEAAKEFKARGYTGNLVIWSEKEQASGIDDLLLKKSVLPNIKRIF